ncbi:MAG: IS66 family transposase [Acetobacteraceae bacterium]
MERASVELPDLDALNVAELKALLLQQYAENLSHRAEIEALKLMILKLRRLQFGQRSEKRARQIDQLELWVEELETADAHRTCALAEKAECAPARRDPKARREFPAHLPRETQTILPQHSACPDCGGELKHLGDDVSEMLELVPARFKVIRHVRPKLACAQCDTIVQAPAPSRPIERGMAGPGLLAHVLTGKYANHLPLYRQSEIYAREGVELERTLLAQWVGTTSALLTPLTDALRAHVMDAGVIHADDTPIPVLAPGRGKTKTGRLWTYVRDERPAGGQVAPAVWFTYTADRKGEHPQRHLQGFTGILHADGYAGFSKIYDDGRVLEAACWAHVRRKFVELHELHRSPVAAEMLDRIGALYAIEKEIRGRSPDERRASRHARSRPLLNSMNDWLQRTLRTLSQKSEAAKAIRYALTRWEALGRYCQDGRIEIDNNAAERSLRCVALGRKNFLFAGSDAGGERAAAIYSLLGSAKLNGHNPEAFLREVLTRIAEQPISRISELLPWNLKTAAAPAPQLLELTATEELPTSA